MDFLKARPFQIILVAAFVILAMLSLFLFATFKGNGNKTIKVGSVAIWGVLPQSAISSVLGTYTNTHQEFGHVSYVQKQADTFDTDLAQGIASGEGPDLILISQEQLHAEQNKITLLPFASVIPQRTYLNSFVPEAGLFLTSTGTYGLPLVLDPLVLFFNRDKLASVGAAAAPSSWEAITGLAPALTTRSGTEISASAIALGQYGNIGNARAILSLLLLQSGNAITATQNSGIYKSTLLQTPTSGVSGTSPAESALNFFAQFSDPAKVVYSWNASLPDARAQFLAGNSALYLGFASEEPLLKAGNPNLNFDMAPIPQPQNSSTKATYGLLYAFALPKAAHNATGAIMTAQALTGSTPAAMMAHALSMAPALRSGLVPSSSDLYQAVYYPEALYAKGWISPSVGTTDGIFATMISAMTSGRMSTSEAISKADQALTSAL